MQESVDSVTAHAIEVKKRRWKASYERRREKILEQKRASYNADKPKHRKQQADWRARNPDIIKRRSLEYYQKNKAVISEKQKAYQKNNPEYHKKRLLIYRAKNREALAAKRKEYNKTEMGRLVKLNSRHKRRAKIKSAGPRLNAAQLSALKAKAKKCHYCQNPLKEKTLDHVIPLDRGGLHALSNLLVCCPSCNSKKHSKAPDVWAKEIGMLILA